MWAALESGVHQPIRSNQTGMPFRECLYGLHGECSVGTFHVRLSLDLDIIFLVQMSISWSSSSWLFVRCSDWIWLAFALPQCWSHLRHGTNKSILAKIILFKFPIFRKLKNGLKQLQEDYLKSKSMNPIMRYMKLQQSVREVSSLWFFCSLIFLELNRLIF